MQGDGKIVSAGTASGGSLVVERRRSGGALDTTFAGDGRASFALGSQTAALDVLLRLDGRIVVTGTAGGRWLALRLLPDGRLDPVWGTGGRVAGPFDGAASDAALQADGRLVLAGTVPLADGSSVGAVARLQGDPVAFCAGKRPTIAGTGLVLGSTGADVIVTSDGADSVIAGAGNDTVCAGDGDDALDGGSGADALYGGAGADVMKS